MQIVYETICMKCQSLFSEIKENYHQFHADVRTEVWDGAHVPFKYS